jgi:hypothetical protein
MELLRHSIHLFGHLLLPLGICWLFFRNDWKRAYVFMLLTLLVDLDHLLADPIFDPGRCSIGFHLLHRPIPIMVYLVMCFIPSLRYLGLGLVLHMITDGVDCWFLHL